MRLFEGASDAEKQEERAVLDSISEDGVVRPERAVIGSTSDDGKLPSSLTMRWEGRAIAGSRGGAVAIIFDAAVRWASIIEKQEQRGVVCRMKPSRPLK